MKIWNAASSNQFHVIVSQFFKQAQAIVFVYDVSSEDSFIYARKQVEEAME